MAGPTILSLFSGVGGLELAVRLAIPGSSVVGYVERDSFACAALMARMEESSMDLAPIFVGKIQDVDGREFRGEVDIVCGGIPCQPYSVAGAQLGNRDERALWHEFARIVEECEPSMVFIENVPTFVTGAGFRPLGEELCRLGFRIADPLFIGAGDVGAPHLRKRVFVLAYRDLDRSEAERRLGEPDAGERAPQRHDADGCDEGLADAENGDRRSGESREETGTREDGERGRRSAVGGVDVDDTRRERLQGEHQGGAETRAIERADGGQGSVRERGVSDAERDAIRDEPERGGDPAREAERGDAVAGDLGLFPPGPDDEQGWRRALDLAPHLAPAVEPGLRLLVDGLPVVLDESRADQLRCAGNAVVVPQALIAIRQLLRWIEGE